MLRRSAEDEIAYAFAPPSTRVQQQWCESAFSRRGERSEFLGPLRAAPTSASTVVNSSITTSESDEDNGSDSNGATYLVTHSTNTKTRANETTANSVWQESDGDAAFRHFRKKRVVTVTSLQMDVNDLKAEVANLQLLRGILASRVMVRRDDTAGSLMRTARAYYEHFKDGYDPQSLSMPAKRKRSLQHVGQAAFLQSILSPTMEAGPLEVGLPLMLEQWRRYSAFFSLHKFKMTCADVVITDQVAIVRTKGKFTMRVTPATIAGIFPHLQHQPKQQTLVDRILGRVLTCPCFVDLYFDTQGQVIRYDEAGDFLGAFSSLLTSPCDLAELFDGALLWEAGVIGSLEPIGIDDASGAFIACPPVTVAADKGRQVTRVRKLYEIDFLLNHEFMDGDETVSAPSELNLYEYDDDERTVYKASMR